MEVLGSLPQLHGEIYMSALTKLGASSWKALFFFNDFFWGGTGNIIFRKNKPSCIVEEDVKFIWIIKNQRQRNFELTEACLGCGCLFCDWGKFEKCFIKELVVKLVLSYVQGIGDDDLLLYLLIKR